MYRKLFAQRLTGLILSLFLTLTAYFIIVYPSFFHLKSSWAIVIISILAILQFSVQFIFFINMWKEEGPPWNMAVFVSTLSIIFIILAGSLWIMHHLNTNMMH